MVAQQSAYEEVSDAQIFKQVFGSDSARIRPIMSGWFAVSRLPAILSSSSSSRRTGLRPSSSMRRPLPAILSLPAGDDVAGLTLNQVFADIDQFMYHYICPAGQSNAAIAQEYGLPLVAYEGGDGLPSGAWVLNSAVFAAAQNDPRMYQALRHHDQRLGAGRRGSLQ